MEKCKRKLKSSGDLCMESFVVRRSGRDCSFPKGPAAHADTATSFASASFAFAFFAVFTSAFTGTGFGGSTADLSA